MEVLKVFLAAGVSTLFDSLQEKTKTPPLVSSPDRQHKITFQLINVLQMQKH